MKKGEVIDQILFDLYPEGRSTDDKIDERDVRPILDQKANYLAKAGWFANMQFGYPGMDNAYLATFKNIEVKEDKDMNEYYIELPGTPVQLPQQRGLDLVAPMKQRANAMKIVQPNFAANFKNLPAGKAILAKGQSAGYMEKQPDGKTHVRFVEKPTFTKAFVRMGIVDTSALNDDAEYPVAPDQLSELITAVVDQLRPRLGMPVDKAVNATEENRVSPIIK